MEFVLKWLVVKPSKCQKAIKATKATKATKLGFCSCGQGVFFSQYVLQLLVVKISKSQKERSKGHKGRKGHKGHVGLHATIEWRSILVVLEHASSFQCLQIEPPSPKSRNRAKYKVVHRS